MQAKPVFTLITLCALSFILLACSPVRDKYAFRRSHSSYDELLNGERNMITGGVAGAISGGLSNSARLAIQQHTIAGVALGAMISATPAGLNKRLRRSGIETVHLGDNIRIIMPSDEMFVFNTPKFKHTYFEAMNNVVSLIRFFNGHKFVVAAYNDDIDYSEKHTQLSQARAEAVRGYLWAHGIDAHTIDARGMGTKNPVANNHTVRGMRYNRRVEISFRSPEWNSFI